MLGKLLSGAGKLLGSGRTQRPRFASSSLTNSQMRRERSNMRLGSLRAPSAGRIARGIAPIAAITAIPTAMNMGFGLNALGGVGSTFSDKLSTGLALLSRGGLGSMQSPFANSQVQKSARSMGDLMRGTSNSAISMKNNAISRSSYHFNNRSGGQMNTMGLHGSRI